MLHTIRRDTLFLLCALTDAVDDQVTGLNTHVDSVVRKKGLEEVEKKVECKMIGE